MDLNKFEHKVALSFQLVKKDITKLQEDLRMLAQHEKVASAAYVETQRLNEKYEQHKKDLSSALQALAALQRKVIALEGSLARSSRLVSSLRKTHAKNMVFFKKELVSLKKKHLQDLASLKKMHARDVLAIKKRLTMQRVPVAQRIARKVPAKKSL